MNRNWFSIAAIIIVASFLLSVSSCGHNQGLVSISIVPSGFTYGSAAPPGTIQTPIPLTAYGTYVHPPETKDITDQVIWASDVTAIALVDSTGHLTAGPDCGSANISASVFTNGGNKNGNVVVGYMFVTVDGPASLGCPQSNAQSNLTVTIGGGTGTVTSSPAGIDCGPTCSAQFVTGTPVTLTGTPTAPSTSVTWGSGNCDSGTGSVCTVLLEGDREVTATFQ
jgi:hypothetical protein